MTYLRLTVLVGALAIAWPAFADGVLEVSGTDADGAVPAQPMDVASWSFGANQSGGMQTGRQAAAPSPKVGDEVTIAVRYRESPTRPGSGGSNPVGRAVAGDCVKGQHIKQATLRIDGRTYVIGDLEVTACTVSAGQRQGELKGHVTLIK